MYGEGVGVVQTCPAVPGQQRAGVVGRGPCVAVWGLGF